MAGLSASGLKTQIRSYTEVDSNVLSDSVLENIILNHKRCSSPQDEIEINVIVGSACTDYDDLKSLAVTDKLKVSILFNPENISQLILLSH